MRVTVLYFAGLRDAVGLAEENLELPPEARTVGDFLDLLCRLRAAVGQRRTAVRVARNEAFVALHERLEDGDTLALIPPVAGG